MNANSTGQTAENGTSGSYSGRSSDEIEAEIEGTRERLTRTLDALQWRLSPRRRFNAAKDSARELSQRVVRTATDSMTPDITTMIRLDHTHALAVFRRYRPATSLGRKRALVANVCLALEIHAQLEEEIFYPALREVVGRNELLDKSEPEHQEMRQLIQALRTMEVGDPAFDDAFHMLMRAVLHHVADEESTLLPLAEELFPERLGELGLQMTKRRLELLGPHAGEVAMTTARSFPVATGAVVAGVLALGWLLVRGATSRRS